MPPLVSTLKDRFSAAAFPLLCTCLTMSFEPLGPEQRSKAMGAPAIGEA
jgi:hypothetical protein